MLKFPNARLAIYTELLRSDRNCAETLIEFAYKLGIVPHGSLGGFSFKPDGHECGAQTAGKAIVQASLAANERKSGVHADSELVWQAITTDLNKYAETIVFQHIADGGPLECGRMAPILLDFILQHLG